MKMKVNGIWRMISLLVLGIVIGIWISIKHISPPSQDISIGRIKIKGKNTITDGIDIEKNDNADTGKKKFKLFKRNR